MELLDKEKLKKLNLEELNLLREYYSKRPKPMKWTITPKTIDPPPTRYYIPHPSNSEKYPFNSIGSVNYLQHHNGKILDSERHILQQCRDIIDEVISLNSNQSI